MRNENFDKYKLAIVFNYSLAYARYNPQTFGKQTVIRFRSNFIKWSLRAIIHIFYLFPIRLKQYFYKYHQKQK